MWTKLGMALLVVLVVLGAVVATRPDNFTIERSAVLAAPPEVVFQYVNDFHRWEEWSPFEDMDPTMLKTYEGPSSGVDARYHWKGRGRAGEGRMRIAESEPARRIAIDMQFIEPFESTSRTTFTFEPVANGTRVTWGMAGRNTTMGKAISLVASMDDMVGREFEEGLAKLGTVAEAEVRRLSSGAADTGEAARAQ
jgi:uncharacterized protein YndB with AHSA1/START domain